MNPAKLEKYKRELQSKIEVHINGSDQKLLLDYHRMAAAKSKEDLIERARKAQFSEVEIKEHPFEIKARRGSNLITFKEATFVRYLHELQSQLKELHSLEKFRGFFLVFPDPKFPDYPDKYKDIPFAYLIMPAPRVELFGQNLVKMTRIYRAHMTDKKPDTIETLNVLLELEKPFNRYLENAYLSSFGYNKLFYRPTYPYIHW